MDESCGAFAPLYPDIVLRRECATSLASVYNTARLDKQRMAFTCGASDMFDALWHNEHFPGLERDGPVLETDLHLAVQHQEDLVGVFMIMPDELALQFHELELVVVHFRDDPRGPALRESGQLLRKVDYLGSHDVTPISVPAPCWASSLPRESRQHIRNTTVLLLESGKELPQRFILGLGPIRQVGLLLVSGRNTLREGHLNGFLRQFRDIEQAHRSKRRYDTSNFLD